MGKHNQPGRLRGVLTAPVGKLPGRVLRGVTRRLLPTASTSLVVREFDGHPMVVRPSTPDEQVLERESFSRDPYFAMIPDYLVSRDDVIVHVGAHVGGFAVHAAEYAGRVYAIEACRETYLLLKANAALNGHENLIASHLALSDRRGTVTLFRSDQGNWGNSLIRHGVYQGEETVPSMSLADYFDEHGIARCHLMALNCEGAEFAILLSTTEAVLARVDNFIVRFHCDLAPQYAPDTLLRFFEARGYCVSVVADKGKPGQRGTVIARRPLEREARHAGLVMTPVET